MFDGRALGLSQSNQGGKRAEHRTIGGINDCIGGYAIKVACPAKISKYIATMTTVASLCRL
jgi:hypothetical protein